MRRKIIEDVENGKYSQDIEAWIYEMDSQTICRHVVNTACFCDALLTFAQANDAQAEFAVKNIKEGFKSACRSWVSYDSFSRFAYQLLIGKVSFPIKEEAAMILGYNAHSIGRFSSQNLIEKVISMGIDPLLEDILNGNSESE